MSSNFENDPAMNHESPTGETNAGAPEQLSPTVESLLDRLDFPITPALREAQEAMIAGMRDETTDAAVVPQAWGEYASIVEAIVESAQDSPEEPHAYAKAHIGAGIHKALIFFAAGNTLRYLEELDLAESHAHLEHFDEVRDVLLREIDSNIDSLEFSAEALVIKLKRVISEPNRAWLRDLIEQGVDYEDIRNNAYNMIEDEGGDADEILTELGELDP